MNEYDEILKFWFEDIDADTELTPQASINKKWFAKSDELDAEIKEKFASDLDKARRGHYDAWQETPEGTIALVILLDQFSRNIYRNSAKAFDADLQALECCLVAIKKGFDKKMNFFERSFLFMPMMHSENIKIQEMAIEFYTKQLKRAEEEEKNVSYAEYQLKFAQRHFDIVKEFQRFPHRNKILKRRSTSAETEFLTQPGSGF